MTTGTVKTQGTELFTVDALSSSVAAVLKMACPTGITGLGGAADQIETTCLDATVDREYARGLGNPGQVSVPFNFIPTNSSHQFLIDLSDAGDIVEWMVCLSEGTADPTLDSSDSLVAPDGRTSAKFNAYIADLNFDIATNEIVRGTMTLQRSGTVTWAYNAPAP
jgi:hypothetical protein